MKLQKDQFPITIQAFELRGGSEFFIAEQVVNNQGDVDAFSNKYAGKIIKAKAVATTSAHTTHTTNTTYAASAARTHNRKSSSATVFIVILLLLAILIAIGFYTGWIQRTTGIRL